MSYEHKEHRESLKDCTRELKERVTQSTTRDKARIQESDTNAHRFAGKHLAITFMSLFIVFAFAASVSALEIVTPLTVSANQSTSTFFNFTINNSAVGSANITIVNVTLPAGFTYTATSNGASTGTNFSNITLASGSRVSWLNSTGAAIIKNNTNQSFWFNATANLTTVGVFHFNLSLQNDSTPSLVSYFDVVVTINDTLRPNITVTSPAAQTYTGTTNFTLPLITTITDNSGTTTNWYVLNGGTNTTFTGSPLITAIAGSNTIVIWANDSTGNLASSSVTFTFPTGITSANNLACTQLAGGIGALGNSIAVTCALFGLIIVIGGITLLIMTIQGHTVLGLGTIEIAGATILSIFVLFLTAFVAMVSTSAICPGV